MTLVDTGSQAISKKKSTALPKKAASNLTSPTKQAPSSRPGSPIQQAPPKKQLPPLRPATPVPQSPTQKQLPPTKQGTGTKKALTPAEEALARIRGAAGLDTPDPPAAETPAQALARIRAAAGLSSTPEITVPAVAKKTQSTKQATPSKPAVKKGPSQKQLPTS
jgi:hypothetical protein